jgi:hypothetical protein
MFALAVGLAIARVGFLTQAGGVRLSADWIMADFFSGVYYPVRAVLSGENPHDRERFLALYPVDDGYPPYLPINLLIHLPFGLLPPATAAGIYFLFNLTLTILLAYFALRLAGVTEVSRSTILLAALILFSRPGHWNLVLGQRAAELAVAVYVALYFARRAPRLSAVAVAIALIKPTYGLPVGLLMLAAGHRQAAILGLTVGAAVNIPLLGFLATRQGGVRPFVESLTAGYRTWQQVEDVNPATSSVRVDAASTVSRFGGHALPDGSQIAMTLIILVIAAAVLRAQPRTDEPGSRATVNGIICLAVVLTAHHVGYDLLLLTAPCVALVLRGLPTTATRPWSRWLLAGMFAVPALNWLSTRAVLEALQPSPAIWLLITSANGVCVIILFAAYLWYGMSTRLAGGTSRRTTASYRRDSPSYD